MSDRPIEITPRHVNALIAMRAMGKDDSRDDLRHATDSRADPRHATASRVTHRAKGDQPPAIQTPPRASGFVLATLAGGLGLTFTLALWSIGAPLLLILASYIATPVGLLGLLGLCTASIPTRYRREYRRKNPATPFHRCDANV